MKHLRMMTAKYSASLVIGGTLALGSAALLTACERDNTPGDAINNAGDATGDAIDGAIDNTNDAIDDTGDAIDDNIIND